MGQKAEEPGCAEKINSVRNEAFFTATQVKGIMFYSSVGG